MLPSFSELVGCLAWHFVGGQAVLEFTCGSYSIFFDAKRADFEQAQIGAW